MSWFLGNVFDLTLNLGLIASSFASKFIVFCSFYGANFLPNACCVQMMVFCKYYCFIFLEFLTLIISAQSFFWKLSVLFLNFTFMMIIIRSFSKCCSSIHGYMVEGSILIWIRYMFWYYLLHYHLLKRSAPFIII